jgi:hypothetical protein
MDRSVVDAVLLAHTYEKGNGYDAWTRIETEATLGSDPSVSVSSVFPSSLMPAKPGIEARSWTEIPRFAGNGREERSE